HTHNAGQSAGQQFQVTANQEVPASEITLVVHRLHPLLRRLVFGVRAFLVVDLVAFDLQQEQDVVGQAYHEVRLVTVVEGGTQALAHPAIPVQVRPAR